MHNFAIGPDQLHGFHAFSSGTDSICMPRRQTMRLNSPRATRSTACTPLRVAVTRSKGVGTATPDMAQNGHANFLVEHFAKRESDGVGDGSRATRWNRLAAGIGGGKLRAFRHNDKAVMATANFALSNGFADGLKRKVNFRDEDDVCSARDAGVQRNPACVASHDFNEHDAMVALRSSVEAVDGLGGDEDGGVETKSDVGGGKVIVNGLGYCNDVHPFAREIAGDVLRTVTADNHKCINAQAAGVFQTKIGKRPPPGH